MNIKLRPEHEKENERTPWAVICTEHGQVFLTFEEYIRQLDKPNSIWTCPKCGEAAPWDDDHYADCMEDDPS